VGLVFCVSQKTLAYGLVVSSILFEDFPEIALTTVPLLMYHPFQILFGGYIIPKFERFIIAHNARDDGGYNRLTDIELTQNLEHKSPS